MINACYYFYCQQPHANVVPLLITKLKFKYFVIAALAAEESATGSAMMFSSNLSEFTFAVQALRCSRILCPSVITNKWF